jgi:hypothetical protein
VVAAGGTLPTETLKAPWLSRVNGDATFTGMDGQLTITARQYAKYWSEDNLESGFLSVFQTSGTTGPLAANEPVLLARIVNAPAYVVRTVKLGNRLLLIGNDTYGNLNTMVVWKAN